MHRKTTPTSALAATLVLGLFVVACRKDPSAAPEVSSATSSSLSAAASPSTAGARDPLERADAAVMQLATTLRGKLQEAMKQGGPAKAIDVCATEAPSLYAQIRKETGVTVGRSSLRLRSEADAPPAWVAEWLRAQGERKAEGLKGVRAIVELEGAPAGRKVARVLKPIGIEATCLACHGDATTLAPDLKRVIDARYPKDAAMGYGLGDLRGAVWAELSLPQ